MADLRFHSWRNQTDSGYHAISIHEGMSLRDWFAGQALASVIEMSDLYFRSEKNADAPSLDEYARDAYRIADAMLAEREKRR